jgi:hypothetical protein
MPYIPLFLGVNAACEYTQQKSDGQFFHAVYLIRVMSPDFCTVPSQVFISI